MIQRSYVAKIMQILHLTKRAGSFNVSKYYFGSKLEVIFYKAE